LELAVFQALKVKACLMVAEDLTTVGAVLFQDLLLLAV
jgi:hypothetical protein